MQSYILTYYRLRKGEPLIALGSHQEGPLNSAASAVPHSLVGGGGGSRFEQPPHLTVVMSYRLMSSDVGKHIRDNNLTVVAPNCL